MTHPRRPQDRFAARLGTAVLVVAALGACGDDPQDEAATSTPSPSPAASTLDPASLDGTSYASTSVEGRDLAADSTVEITFQDDIMSVWAGCNTLFGAFEVDGSTLAWSSEPAATMMMCDPELADQDQWITGLLTAGMTATADATTLTLESQGVTLEMASEAPDDLASLLGRTWTVIGTVAEGAVSRLPVNARQPRLDVGVDGLTRLFTGCRSGRTTVRVDGQTLVFANTTVQRGRCSGAARVTEKAVLELLDGPSDNAELHEHLLIVTRGGRGLAFEIR